MTQNASVLLWSVGGSLVSSALDIDAAQLSKRFDASIAASEDSELFKRTPSVAMYGAGGDELATNDTARIDLTRFGYTASAFVRYADFDV